MTSVLVRDGVRRNAVLPTLGTRTWRARAVAARALGERDATSSRAAYAAWLARVRRAWSRLPTLSTEGGRPWPLLSVSRDGLALGGALAADLADVSDIPDVCGAEGAPGGGEPGGAEPAPVPAPAGSGQLEAPDEAFVIGATYVAVVAATDASVLAGPARSLAAREPAPVGTRFLSACGELAHARAALRRELAAWAAVHGPEATERLVLTARTLMIDVAEVLRS